MPGRISRSIIYGDLKPVNLFIDWNWMARIGDCNHTLLADESGLTFEQEISTLTSMRSRDCRYAVSESLESFLLT
jgi:hypothetical protein